MPALAAATRAAPLPDSSPPDDHETVVEEVARESLGLFHRDRLALYRETAAAATDTDTPFWAVLLLSGAIATLGLTLSSTAVVIGAMLVAPLLGPILGLSLALAVGDGRLALQTAATVALGAASVVALAALLTAVLPFHAVTAEIASRTRPTTLDLAIAVASGLAGAVVTASRRSTLSASIPGVAVAVALIPPLGVTGFGIGTSRVEIVTGSLLLFGANLAGIVLSGLVVFLLVGMHRADVVEAARAWHRAGSSTGLAERLERVRGLDRVRVFGSPWARGGLVLLFFGLVAWPLTATLHEVIRETRVQAAATSVAARAEAGGLYVLGQSVSYGTDRATVRLRVASARPLRTDAGERLSRDASRRAGEPVAVHLDRVLTARDGRPTVVRTTTREPVEAEPVSMEARLAAALGSLALPDSARAVAIAVGLGGPPPLRVAYAAPRRLPPEAEAMLARQAARAAGLSEAGAAAVRVPLGRRALPPDSAAAAATLRALAAPLHTFSALRLAVTAPDSSSAARFRTLLADTPPARASVTVADGPARARLFAK